MTYSNELPELPVFVEEKEEGNLALPQQKHNLELEEMKFDLARPQSMIELAKVLQKHIKANNLTTRIKDKDYVNVEAWQFAGTHLGLVPIIKYVKNLSTYERITLELPGKNGTKYTKIIKHYKYRATCILRDSNTGAELGRAVMICSNEEATKVSFEEHAILSMAETRATAKAFRLLLGWTMKIAGFEATPVEEMPQEPQEIQKNEKQDINPASEKQKMLLLDLINNPLIKEFEREATLAIIDTMTARKATKCIEKALLMIAERKEKEKEEAQQKADLAESE